MIDKFNYPTSLIVGAFMKEYEHLIQEKRYQIWALMKTNLNQTEVAEEIGVDKSTISRELKRNSGLKGYRLKQAQRKADIRKKVSASPYKLTPKMILFIREKLKENWSPEQISGYLKATKQPFVTHTWIYSRIRANKTIGGKLYTYLRRANKKCKKRYGSINTRGQIKNRILIDERPEIVKEKIRI